jgi:hypothetical protein
MALRERAGLLELLRPCFARTQVGLHAGKYLTALAGGPPRVNGWSIARRAGDRTPGHALIGARQWIPREHIEDPARATLVLTASNCNSAASTGVPSFARDIGGKSRPERLRQIVSHARMHHQPRPGNCRGCGVPCNRADQRVSRSVHDQSRHRHPVDMGSPTHASLLYPQHIYL